MAKAKGISDEQLIAALLSNGTIKQAAAAAGLSERALYDRMAAADFQTLYKNAKADIIREAVIKLNSNLQAAIDTAAEIMTDSDVNPATRLQAAQTILNNAAKFTQRLHETDALVLEQAHENKMQEKYGDLI